MSELRDTIRAAMQGEAPEAFEEAPPETVAAETPEAAIQSDDGASDRDEKGRFKPKDAAAPVEAAAVDPAEASEPAAAAEPEPPKEAIRVPPHLPAALKADYANLSDAWRDFIAKGEEGVQNAKAEWGRKGERLNRLDEIIAPHRDAWAMQGLDETQALTRLVAAEKSLRENPTQAIIYLAQAYGADLSQFGQTSGANPYGGQGFAPPVQQASSLDPALHPILERFQTLEQRLVERETMEAERQSSTLQAQIAEFAGKPENMYFENVREDVAVLLETGRAETLQDAYDKAVWLNPETRSLLIAEQDRKRDNAAKEAAKKAEADARAKSQAAQRAAGSVTGAPSPGASAPRPGSTGNLRADLEAALKEHQAAV